MTFSLTGYNFIPTDGTGRVLITDINPNGVANFTVANEEALICTSETVTSDSDGGTNWFLHPTQMSINDDDRISQVC